MRVGFGSSTQPYQRGESAPPRKLFRALAQVGVAVAVLAPTAASGAATLHRAAGSAARAKAVAPAKLHAGRILSDGSFLRSPNGRYRLVMQGDGNLVLYWEGHAIWASDTRHHAGDFVTMQGDGNLVIYQGHRPLWASGSAQGSNSAYYLSLQNDGNAVIYSPSGKAIWQTRTAVGIDLQLGDTGPAVLALQTYLVSLGYWLGTPDGVFGDSTQQAVYALEKAGNLVRSGVVGTQASLALARGVRPKPRPASGNLIEVDLQDDLLMIIQNGKLVYTLNTSTGGGYTYTDDGVTSVAITPTGIFHIYATIDGLDVDSLGALWRPRFFEGGFAIHGDSYVPPVPVSHGCVRVSNEAIDWIWANNIAPIGEEVWVY
jgi:L,D-transpeptidase-like protein/putative peptidoglycan binding protein